MAFGSPEDRSHLSRLSLSRAVRALTLRPFRSRPSRRSRSRVSERPQLKQHQSTRNPPAPQTRAVSPSQPRMDRDTRGRSVFGHRSDMATPEAVRLRALWVKWLAPDNAYSRYA